MYVIFYNNKPIYLSSQAINCDTCLELNYDDIDILGVLTKMDNSEFNSVCFVQDDLDDLYKKFIKHFEIIETAGGLVKNAKQQLLFIFRNGVWDLPKGKIETNETIATAALREVEEECGVTDLTLESFFEKTYHIYKHKGQFVFKITHWFTMSINSNQTLTPQLEEDITKVQFLDREDQLEALKNTYPNIKMLVESYNSASN